MPPPLARQNHRQDSCMGSSAYTKTMVLKSLSTAIDCSYTTLFPTRIFHTFPLFFFSFFFPTSVSLGSALYKRGFSLFIGFTVASQGSIRWVD